ncbi:hypothetical protein [Enhygromyxa salina]|uniref:Uncharacterized protein n=1 Tax=Enhygromyxa salina TaxID=215803 RepID=A0A2S9YNE1_9BACT|nr:hypothetical protein [Enhygromyxa salina]PRQ06569.1 hypothetical protein ENSA7_37220 [Enhygromyxa salina]
MNDYRSDNGGHTIEVGGPGGIRINSIIPAPAMATNSRGPTSATPSAEPGSMIALATRHPIAVSLGLVVAAVAALVGPLVLVLALEAPMWLMVGPALLCVALIAGAIAAPRGALKALRRAYGEPALEQQILNLALRCGGRLTVPMTAQHLKLTLADAERALMDLARAGHVDIDNDPTSGAVIYVFRDFNAPPQPLAESPQ